MKESTKTGEVKMEEITKESLSNLSEGYFRVPISENQTGELLSSIKMREHWGVPRPFHGEFGDNPIEEGFLYLWVRKSVTVLYLAEKFKPTKLQELHGRYPKFLVLQHSISPSDQKETLEKIANILDPQKQWCIALVKWRWIIFTLSLMSKNWERKEKVRHDLE